MENPAVLAHRSTRSQALTRGFWSLRFEPAVEHEFREIQNHTGRYQLRTSLLVAGLLLAFIPIVDYGTHGQSFSSIVYPLRSLMMAPALLAMLAVSLTSNNWKQLSALSIVAGLLVGACSAALNASVEAAGLPGADLGYVMAIFYIFFFVGLRFYAAFFVATTLFLSLLVFGLVSAEPPQGFAKDVLLAGFGTIMGATGLYNLEYSQRSAFLKEKELIHIASNDPLTGLANRKAFDEHLHRMWQHCASLESSLAVALIDIDHFKAYNDTYGHQHGDRCLSRVADVLKAAFRRPLDITARYGGEEFVVVMPDIDHAKARERIEDVRAMIDRLTLEHSSSPTAPVVTVSAGVALVWPHKTSRSIAGLIQTADTALYEAKSAGRNRVVVAGDDDTELSSTGVVNIKSKLKALNRPLA